MEDDLGSDRGWNIFARELALILNARGYRLGHLNDRAGIHPQQVSRLQRALRQPRFNVLSPGDLDRVISAFGLTREETLRLRAAVLATAIEDMLMDRIDAEDALSASEQIFPILLRALREPTMATPAIGAIKGGVMNGSDNDAGGLEEALRLLDSALLYLHLAQDVAPERAARYGSIALTILRTARARLDALTPDEQSRATWQAWHDEILRAEQAALQLTGS
ncbi:MAG TPA: hypothetical protein VFQ25_13760 [Ktedonobacterales bacterium]|nr:hypothetical protein [Ktedonobacterales bacterium]